MKKQLIIAGPCAAESKEQVLVAAREAKKRQVDFMRACLWKPRTRPGFEGLGEEGIDLLVEVAKLGMAPATEVLLPEQAQQVMEKILTEVPESKLLLWIGARNQNHFIQREIARVVASDPRVMLLVKNQPWKNEDHWEGVAGHVLDGGIDPKRVILCHRGFMPNGVNPHGYRNVPAYDMAMSIREKTGLKMVFDPSHTGGSVPNVFHAAGEASKYDFDGLMVEVHPNPTEAKTDAGQQLTWGEFDRLMMERQA